MGFLFLKKRVASPSCRKSRTSIPEADPGGGPGDGKSLSRCPMGAMDCPGGGAGGIPHARSRLAVDAGEVDLLVDVCRDVDGLVIESTYLDEEADMARHFGHLTARKAARTWQSGAGAPAFPHAHLPALP